MTDIVELLRDLLSAELPPNRRAIIEGAADEIERLRRENLHLRQRSIDLNSACASGLRREQAANDEIERLREALRWYAGDGSTYDGIDIGQRARAALEGK